MVTPTQLYNDPTKIDWRVPIVIDFETYYDKEYSLSKITTEKYIRCDEFECIGVAVKIGNNPTYFYKRETGIEIIRHIVTTTYPNSPVVMQNAMFDAGILAFRYNIHPSFVVDTTIMAKLCGFDRVAGGSSLAKMSAQLQKMGIYSQVKGNEVHNMLGVHADDMTAEQWQSYGEYCKLDVDLTHALYEYMLPQVPTSELIMADITTKMWTKPMIELDVPLLENYAVQLEQEREQLLSAIAGDFNLTNDELLKNLRSSKKFVALLERLNVPVPMKYSEKQDKMIPAISKTDVEFLELQEHPNEKVRALVETKLGTMSNMEQTRTATFLDVASRGLCPIPLRYASAHTGRYGGCFIADTKIWVLEAVTTLGVYTGVHDWSPQLVKIAAVRKNDLVWNGDDFVKHDGVVCNGIQPVIQYQGLVGTYGHQVFVVGRTDTVDLGYAKEHNLELVLAHTPHNPVKMATVWDDLRPDRIKFKSDNPIAPEIRARQDTDITYPDGVLMPVYDIVNVGDTHRYVANGYLVHNSDKLNFQNLSKRTKDPVLRRSMRAMDGHIVIASDSSQIENRLACYIANQQDVIDVFLGGRDVYIDMATKIYNESYEAIYDQSKANPTKEGKTKRNIAKAVVLGCGYGASANKFAELMKQQGLAEYTDMADELVNTYRSSNHMIVNAWRECDKALQVMHSGGRYVFGGANNDLFIADGSTVFHGVTIPSVQLPNGTYIFYQNLRIELDEETGREQFVYDQFKGKNWLPKRIWGSAFFENLCIAEDTLVLTDSGWKKIQDITNHDKVHDGVEFVTHGGLVFKSVKDCVKIDGVYMTKDHEVLTNDGWKTAELHLSAEATSQLSRFDFSEVWQADCYQGDAFRRKEVALGLPMRLRKNSKQNGMQSKKTSKKRWNTSLRLQYIRDCFGQVKFARLYKAPNLLDMAEYESSLPKSKPQGLEKLWWQGYNCMRTMVGLSNVLVRYVTKLSTGFGFRPQRQQSWVSQGELPLGYTAGELQQQTQQCTHTGWQRTNDSSRVLRAIQTQPHNSALSVVEGGNNATTGRETECKKAVYDILNCGSRNRFVVKGDTAPFVVHNCQALAFDILKYQAIEIAKAGVPVNLNVHDEWVSVVPREQAPQALVVHYKAMKSVPSYIPDGLLDCEVDIGWNYGTLNTVNVEKFL